MLAVHGMRAVEQIVEGKGEERERLGAQALEGRVGGGGAMQGDDGIQGASYLTV